MTAVSLNFCISNLGARRSVRQQDLPGSDRQRIIKILTEPN